MDENQESVLEEETSEATTVRILDEDGNEIENPDLTLGYLQEEELLVQTIPAVPAVTAKTVGAFYFKDGSSLFPEPDDEHIKVISEPLGLFDYQDLGEGRILRGMTVKTYTVSEEVPEQKIYETINRYIRYTDDELFLHEAPERLEEAETTVDDLVELVADLSGSDIEERVAETQETLDDILIYIADIAGGADEEETTPVEDDTIEEDTIVEDETTTEDDTTVEDTTVEEPTVDDTTAEDTTVEDTTVEDTTVDDTTTVVEDTASAEDETTSVEENTATE